MTTIASFLRRRSAAVVRGPRADGRIGILPLFVVVLVSWSHGDSQVTESKVAPGSVVVEVTARGEPVAGIPVRLSPSGSSTVLGPRLTDGSGVSRFEDLDPGPYEAVVEPLPGFTVASEDRERKSVNATSGGRAEVVFALAYSSSVSDVEGHVYRTVPVGDRMWMAENLNVARFSNGDPIPELRDDIEWQTASEDEAGPAWAHYENDPANGAAYGKLYSRLVVDDERGVCPEGWRVPTDDEWKELELALGMTEAEVNASGWRGDIAGKLRSVRTAPDPSPRWDAPNVEASDESGFSGLPGGYRTGRPNYDAQQTNAFVKVGAEAVFWTVEGGGRSLWSDRIEIYRGGRDSSEGFGFSVRCIED